GSSQWSELADWVHRTAACLWAGGVVQLLAVGERRREAFVRFARLAPVLIAALLAAGIYLAVVRLPALDDLWTERYGVILLVKIGLVCLALAWGAFHHFVVTPRLDRPGVLARTRRTHASWPTAPTSSSTRRPRCRSRPPGPRSARRTSTGRRPCSQPRTRPAPVASSSSPRPRSTACPRSTRFRRTRPSSASGTTASRRSRPSASASSSRGAVSTSS